MKLLCRLGWHEYTRWEEAGEVLIRFIDDDHPDSPQATENYLKQQRECVHCGIKKMRRERK